MVYPHTLKAFAFSPKPLYINRIPNIFATKSFRKVSGKFQEKHFKNIFFVRKSFLKIVNICVISPTHPGWFFLIVMPGHPGESNQIVIVKPVYVWRNRIRKKTGEQKQEPESFFFLLLLWRFVLTDSQPTNNRKKTGSQFSFPLFFSFPLSALPSCSSGRASRWSARPLLAAPCKQIGVGG